MHCGNVRDAPGVQELFRPHPADSQSRSTCYNSTRDGKPVDPACDGERWHPDSGSQSQGRGMTNDPTDEKLDRIAGELRQIKYLMWFLSCVGVLVVINMLPELLTNVFYAAVFIAALAGLWFLASKAAQIPIVRKWRSENSTVSASERDVR